MERFEASGDREKESGPSRWAILAEPRIVRALNWPTGHAVVAHSYAARNNPSRPLAGPRWERQRARFKHPHVLQRDHVREFH